MIKLPWKNRELLESEDYNWIVQYLLNKDVPLSYLEKPSEKKEKHVKTICQYLLGTRHFMLLLCNNPTYVKELYYYIAATWLLTTETGFEIAGPLDLDPYNQEFWTHVKRLKDTRLLMIPYTDPNDYTLRKTKTALGNIMSTRKAARRPTITDLFIEGSAEEQLSAVFGSQSPSMFKEQDSNIKMVKIRS
ncbi:MAG: hypothetical protein ACOC4Y_01830 [bacterium]